jgi:nucleoside-diphosphate-sugar epimerase
MNPQGRQVAAGSERPRHVLVTGANGFIGARLVDTLVLAGYQVTAVARSQGSHDERVRRAIVSGYHDGRAMGELLAGVDAVIHLAATAHRIGPAASGARDEFAGNVSDTAAVALSCAGAGVRRLVFVSSIGVNGNRNVDGPFTEASQPRPSEPYAISKWKAEQALTALAQRAPHLETVVVRPPLVYGPSAPGNFGRLVRAVARGVPLPLGHLRALRSFVGIDNLASLLERCTWHPAARNDLFLVSDGEDVTTADFIRRLGQALGQRTRLAPVPLPLLRGLARMAGFGPELERLAAPLQVDSGKARALLDWRPPFSLDEGLRRAVAAGAGSPR